MHAFVTSMVRTHAMRDGDGGTEHSGQSRELVGAWAGDRHNASWGDKRRKAICDRIVVDEVGDGEEGQTYKNVNRGLGAVREGDSKGITYRVRERSPSRS